MKLELTDDEFFLVKGMLIGVMQKHNEMLDKGYYMTDEEKLVLKIAKKLLGKLEGLE